MAIKRDANGRYSGSVSEGSPEQEYSPAQWEAARANKERSPKDWALWDKMNGRNQKPSAAAKPQTMKQFVKSREGK